MGWDGTVDCGCAMSLLQSLQLEVNECNEALIYTYGYQYKLLFILYTDN